MTLGLTSPVGRSSSRSDRGNSFWRLIPRLTRTTSRVVTVLGPDGTVRYQSRPVRALLGYEPDRMVGRSLLDLLCASSKARARAALSRMARGEEKFGQWCLQFREASGAKLWLEGMASNFLKDPRLGGILVYWHELT